VLTKRSPFASFERRKQAAGPDLITSIFDP